MLRDALTTFAWKSTAIQAGAGRANLGDVIPIEGDNIGVGQPSMYLVICVEETFVGGTSTQFHLVSDSVPSPATDGSATEHYISGALPIADLVQGKVYNVPLPSSTEYETYLGLQFTNVGTMSAGQISAFLTLNPQQWEALPDNNK